MVNHSEVTTTTTGATALAEFRRAPAPVQTEFFAELAAEVDRVRARDRRIFDLHGIEPAPQRLAKPRWGQRWRDKAYLHNLAEDRGLPVGNTFPAERDRIAAIPPPEYVTRLAGEEPNRAHKICCPLPGHDERSPSFHVHDDPGRGWHCFGCGAGGDIYTLAGAIWNLETRGDSFKEIHRRLMGLFA